MTRAYARMLAAVGCLALAIALLVVSWRNFERYWIASAVEWLAAVVLGLHAKWWLNSANEEFVTRLEPRNRDQ